MPNFNTPNVTIVDTESLLPSAADYSGIAVIKDSGKIAASTGTSWRYSKSLTSSQLGFVPNTDITSSLNAVLLQYGDNIDITFEPGTFIISDTININQSGVTIKGAGRGITVFQFSPSVDKVMFSYTKGASILYYGGISDCSIYSANTTNTKTALYLSDVSQFIASNVNISGFTGKDSIGIRLLGRENNTFEKIFVGADICVKLSPNANTLEWLSVDHCVFRDTYLLANALPTAGGTVPTTCVLIDTKANISGLTFEGRNAWVSGQRGLYHLDTTSTMVSYMIKLSNIRREQPSGSTAYPAIHIERTQTAGRLQALLLENFYNGSNSPNTTQTGLYFRGIDQIMLNNTIIADNTNTNAVLDVDNCTNMEWINAKFLVTNSSTFVVPNMEIVKGTQITAGNVYPVTCSWQKKPVAIYQQVPCLGMNGAKTWEYTGTLADQTQIQIPINTTNGYKHGIIEVVATADDGTDFEAGIFALSVGSNAGGSSTKGVMKISGSAKTYHVNTAGGLMVWCNSATTNLLNNVYIYNRLGKQVTIVARATFY